ncbi:hypothetical protein [Bacillus cereus group sp. BfR-BA-01380]|uniref:hypothetical protein n=1 Tax=Bacillus cereus group sp. BfR-BA-01380 TaxID=2920324 RepID=UPI001F594525|nr:hypothetical protein [Bacillus cereus group sp. BfR-BA-01380]
MFTLIGTTTALISGTKSQRITGYVLMFVKSITTGVGVVWINGTDINLRKGASTGNIVVEQITKVGAYDVHYRYENWIFVNDGWMYFDELYVSWLR